MWGEANWGESGESAARRAVIRRLAALLGVVPAAAGDGVTAVGEGVAAGAGLSVALRSVGIGRESGIGGWIWRWRENLEEVGEELSGFERGGRRVGRKGRLPRREGARERAN